MPFRLIETWNDGEQSTHVETTWPKLIAYLESYDYKDKQSLAVLTIFKVEQ